MKRFNDKIILGTVQFGMDYGINNPNGKLSYIDSFKILDYAYKKGVRELDTANNYGNSEEVIGSYFKQNPHKKFRINTKISSKNDSLEVQMKESLKRLGNNKIHKLYFHSAELYFYFKEDLEKNYSKYKNIFFNEIGVSVYTNEEIQLILDEKYIENIQAPFNLLDNYQIRGNVYEKIKNKGKSLDIRSVFLQGLFFKNINNLKENLYPLKNSITELKKISTQNRISIESLALNYVKNYDFVNNVIIGVDSLEQLKSNFISNNIKLSNLILNQINSIEIKDRSLLNPSKW